MMGAWRAMTARDLDAVSAISDGVHGRYTEPRAIYAERLALYPAGCLVWEREGALAGYLVSHPWRTGEPPALGIPLGGLPATPDSYYLHDLALLPSARGTGAGTAAVRIVVECAQAAGFEDIFLVAVGGADRFWMRQGFAVVPDGGIAEVLRNAYGPGAVYMRRHI